MKNLFLVISFIIYNSSFAQNLPPGWVVDGAYIAGSNRSSHKPAELIRELNYQLNTLNETIELNANQLVKPDQRLTLTMVDRGNIVYSYRKSFISDSSLIISHSMSKSLASIMVGYALCDGLINNLDDKIENYVPELNGTSFGMASIRNILNMASGANASGLLGEPYQGFTMQLREQLTSYIDKLLEYGDPKRKTLNHIQPGERHDYKSLDTATLTLLIEKATNMPFHQWYERTLVKNAGLAHLSGWTLDRDNRAISHALYFASPDDWIRLAIHSLDLYKGRSGQCMQQFMKQAVHDQIDVSDNESWPHFTKYGYQMWTGAIGMNDSVYWKIGYAGQMIGIDPESERIIVVSSTDWDPEIFTLFRSWIHEK